MINRRTLLFGGAALLLLPAESGAEYARPVTMHAEPYQTIATVHRDLFPGGGGAPSPRLLKAIDYLGGVMRDPYVDDDDKRFLTNGARWLNEQARKDYGYAYYRLPPEQRQQVLQKASGLVWGDNWLWSVLSYLFEALLSDPVYGANTHEAGWRWLRYEPGYPRPKTPLI
ncbi:gluconate 2-dehydrogenase subunit 3 family protein [Sulfurimonas sp. HSL-3221]|uniref:gluconate 2-dehydrogenase subunit 3 family protein n=1 Tax=Sulfurimonadaceae TaxID=2771471 RepID=UPI001E3D0997|nr:gluconate 2-dehydrogenase subunit 3 family protein [Sulfurimonas sp. HSL-3221]UFS61326.1 gluconate 2-dehydrogenase subunit 3 family protein [Sulfurimonas sp. HSL-3221]